MRLSQLLESINNFEEMIKAKYGVDTFSVYEKRNEIVLNMIQVPKVNRKAGIGTAVMQELINYADAQQKRIILTPDQNDDHNGTTSRARLVKFYKRFGFVENKGRNKDFEISHGMYRDPQ